MKSQKLFGHCQKEKKYMQNSTATKIMGEIKSVYVLYYYRWWIDIFVYNGSKLVKYLCQKSVQYDVKQVWS